ncbi:MAG: aldo/keto reductase [Christensenellales bacterium]|jgi:aryl-alcohol dehydrogenase-like predicted oxidoreductase
MKRVFLGKTGYHVAPVAYAGIVSMNERQADSDRYVSQAIDAGVNYFDVAPSYGNAEIILGESLKPYRKDVYLACKTTKRKAADAEKEFYQSLKHLHTDWFDVYQLHSLTTMEDVETAFGPGGTMDMVLKLHQQGLVRKIGFSAHSEQVALEALKRCDFDTVMFPLNWMLHKGQGIGSVLVELKREKGFGLLAIKSIVERAWLSEQERRQSIWPKSWCKPFDKEDGEARLAAMRYTLRLGADVLIPPGNWECQSFMASHYEQAFLKAYTSEDEKLLNACFDAVKDHPFFDKDTGDLP